MTNKLTIGLTGDVMIGRLTNEALACSKPEELWGDVLPLLKETDLNLINLEAALTRHPVAVPKVFNFKSDPENVQTLLEASTDVANLANNHVLDYEVEGLLETLTTLDHAGIQYVGAGKTLSEARKPVIISKKEISIGIIGCTDNEPTWTATETSPGIHYVEVGNLDAIKSDIEKLREQVDLLILTIHWGPNMLERPRPYFVQFAHDLIDLGVDIIHGHSAHIFQGVEVYRNKLILYDTGDFVDDYYVDPMLRNDLSFLFLVEVNKQGLQQLRLVPTHIKNCQVHRATGNDLQRSLDRMKMLSAEFNTKLEIKDQSLILAF